MPLMETYRPAMSIALTDAAESDRQLLLRYCTRRDREAMATLLARHTDSAYRLALWASNNPSDAEDIVQDAFVDVLSSAHPKVDNVREWIMRVVITTAHDTRRQEQRRTELYGSECQAIGALPDEILFPHIERVLTGQNAVARENVPMILSLVRYSRRARAYELLVPLLKDASKDMRRGAAKALKIAANPAGIDLLKKRYVEEADRDVKQAIFETLAAMRTDATTQWVFERTADFSVEKPNSVAIRAIGDTRDDRAEELFIKQMQSGPKEMKQYFVQGLGMIQTETAMAHLVEALRSDDDMVRWNAMLFLTRLRDPRAIDLLIAFLKRAPQNWMPACAAGCARWYCVTVSLQDRERIRKALSEYAAKLNQPPALPPSSGDF
jgi:DNA-directed RNA polymerase specialized sigma24 family protein